MQPARGLAFYDLDGTLVKSNVVHQYAHYARQLPPGPARLKRQAKLMVNIPVLFALDLRSRRKFNEYFYRFYRGMHQDWLLSEDETLFARVFQPNLLPGAKELVEADRAAGYRTVLVTGSLDFSLGPLVRHFRFDDVVANKLSFEYGFATGALAPPVLAGEQKVEAIRRLCRQYNVEAAQSKAYSDSVSDLPMLEAVGMPVAANPGPRLRRIATRRKWQIVDLK